MPNTYTVLACTEEWPDTAYYSASTSFSAMISFTMVEN